MMHRDVLGLAGLALLCGLALAWTEKDHQQVEAEHYCDMVRIHAESSGDFGHPNYDNRECNND